MYFAVLNGQYLFDSFLYEEVTELSPPINCGVSGLKWSGTAYFIILYLVFEVFEDLIQASHICSAVGTSTANTAQH